MGKYIYYGASQYAAGHFDILSKKYEPLCFCDLSASDRSMFCGLPVFPPSAMFDRYPDAPVFITRNRHFIVETQFWLIEKLGVPMERIVNFEPYMDVVTCAPLETRLMVGLNHAAVCCSDFGKNRTPVVCFPDKSSPNEKVEAITALRKRIKTALTNGEPCECTGCVALRTRRVSVEPKPLYVVDVSFPHSCNLKCIYCASRDNKTEELDVPALRALFSEMKRAGLIDDATVFVFAHGELATFGRRAELLSAVRDFPCAIFSNCTIYDDTVAKHLELGKTTINCSIDAGTRNTRDLREN